MSEKTAEEKLREELEGNSQNRKAPQKQVKKSVNETDIPGVRSRAGSRRTERPESVGQRVDSFMEDFEKRVAESLNAGKKSVSQINKSVKSRVNKKINAVKTSAEAISSEISDIDLELDSFFGKAERKAAPKPKVTDSLHLHDVDEKLSEAREEHKPEEKEILPDIDVHEQEILTDIHEAQQALPEVKAEEKQEEILPDVEVHDEQVILPDVHEEQEALPEVEADEKQEEVLPDVDVHEEQEILPDIHEEQEALPDIEAHEQQEISHDIDADEQQDNDTDIPVDLVDEPEQELIEELPDIPVIDAEISPDDDSQQNELPDIPVIESDLNFADESTDLENLTDSDDDISEFSEAPIDNQLDNQSDNQPFSPAADLVVSVDSDLPQIQSDSQEFDPESESAPVSITMPETTHTAEDKLMADIAEAMTGSPLTLESTDSSEPYKLPENFFANNNSSSPQSAEDK